MALHPMAPGYALTLKAGLTGSSEPRLDLLHAVSFCSRFLPTGQTFNELLALDSTVKGALDRGEGDGSYWLAVQSRLKVQMVGERASKQGYRGGGRARPDRQGWAGMRTGG